VGPISRMEINLGFCQVSNRTLLAVRAHSLVSIVTELFQVNVAHGEGTKNNKNETKHENA
jgi:hypothetical protein